jgi:hypothetical protein
MPRQRHRDDLRSLSEHVLYEVQMLFVLANRLRAHVDGREKLPWAIEMACVESFGMHTRVLIEFLWDDPSPDRRKRFPDDGFAEDFLPPGKWAEVRPPMSSKLEGLWSRAGREIAHLSYKRATAPEAARHWEFDVIAGAIGRAFRVFL